jgi:hypothetical protein
MREVKRVRRVGLIVGFLVFVLVSGGKLAMTG